MYKKGDIVYCIKEFKPRIEDEICNVGKFIVTNEAYSQHDPCRILADNYYFVYFDEIMLQFETQIERKIRIRKRIIDELI